MEQKTLISWLLRIGIAFSFLYPAIDGFFHPNTWMGFLPAWSIGLFGIEPMTLLLIFEIVEIIVALWLLFARDPRIPAALSALVLAAIVVVDFSAFDIVFRDISILLMALALIALHTSDLYKPSKTAKMHTDQLENNT